MDGATASAGWHVIVAEYGVGDLFDAKEVENFLLAQISRPVTNC